MTERASGSRDLDSICFGLIVKRLRLQRGWTVLQLAQMAGMNRVHIGVIERGGNSPNLQTFIRISHALGADPTAVLAEILRNRAQFQQRA
jgi:transcriptional regulator with XRE-family HTH domain